ncbi:MAG: ATP-binding protein [Chitinophagaceae bacterium]
MMLSDKNIKILIVEDDDDDYFIIEDYIREIDSARFIIEWCNNYESAIEKFQSGLHDLYFVDYRLGSETGLELIKKAVQLQPNSPIILLTGMGNKKIDIEAMLTGATDYLVKSELNAEKLERCIRYALDRAASLRAIKESENKYRNLFARSKDALFIADTNLFFKELNQASLELFGLPGSHLQTMHLYDFILHQLQKDNIRHALINNNSISDFEIEIENAAGEKKTCLLSILQESDTSGKDFVHGIIHDISNIKKAEKANLLTEKLGANERLVRILAHEIRNPLNNIKLAAETMEIANSAAEKKEPMISIIQRNSVRINQMITELLNSTKTADMVFQQHTLQEVVEESLLTTNDRLNLRNIKLKKNFHAVPLPVLADKTKLQIAFSNILINAIEAMEDEKGELFVSIKESLNGYTVSIKDNGIGISPEHLPKLFEPFFTMKKNGIGLGLATAYGIFTSHNARVQIDSVINSGSTFTIDFNKHKNS